MHELLDATEGHRMAHDPDYEPPDDDAASGDAAALAEIARADRERYG